MADFQPFATVTDVADRMGRDLTPTEARMATALLLDASGMVADINPAPYAETARAVVCAMVRRVLLNPSGRDRTEVDVIKFTVNTAIASGQLVILPHEMTALQQSSPVRDGAFTIRSVPQPVRAIDAERGR